MKFKNDRLQKEIKNILTCSSCNCITFDEWKDMKNRKYLGLNVRSFIDGSYRDFLLDFLRLNEERNDAQVLSRKIKTSLLNYGINIFDILTCTTDNCPLMARTAELLDLWRIPCVLHLINLIFQEFINSIKDKITPIFDIIKYVTNSEHYETFIEQKIKDGSKIRKILLT